MLNGTVQEEDGKIWDCTYDPEINQDGNTIISDENNCQLICDGLLVFDLFCAEGFWSIDYLDSAADIFRSEGSQVLALSVSQAVTFS